MDVFGGGSSTEALIGIAIGRFRRLHAMCEDRNNVP
jgi:hypothetical protein